MKKKKKKRREVKWPRIFQGGGVEVVLGENRKTTRGEKWIKFSRTQPKLSDLQFAFVKLSRLHFNNFRNSSWSRWRERGRGGKSDSKIYFSLGKAPNWYTFSAILFLFGPISKMRKPTLTSDIIAKICFRLKDNPLTGKLFLNLISVVFDGCVISENNTRIKFLVIQVTSFKRYIIAENIFDIFQDSKCLETLFKILTIFQRKNR